MDLAVKPGRSRGHPRDLRVRAAILNAARELLDEVRAGAVTIDGVARRAKVSRPTVYRWWPDRHAVVMDALIRSEIFDGLTQQPPEAFGLAALAAQLSKLADRFATPNWTTHHVNDRGGGGGMVSLRLCARRQSQLDRADTVGPESTDYWLG